MNNLIKDLVGVAMILFGVVLSIMLLSQVLGCAKGSLCSKTCAKMQECIPELFPFSSVDECSGSCEADTRDGGDCSIFCDTSLDCDAWIECFAYCVSGGTGVDAGSDSGADAGKDTGIDAGHN